MQLVQNWVHMWTAEWSALTVVIPSEWCHAPKYHITRMSQLRKRSVQKFSVASACVRGGGWLQIFKLMSYQGE